MVRHPWKQNIGVLDELITLSTLMRKEYYLRALFIQRESQSPLTFSPGAHPYLSRMEHSPELSSS